MTLEGKEICQLVYPRVTVDAGVRVVYRRNSGCLFVRQIAATGIDALLRATGETLERISIETTAAPVIGSTIVSDEIYRAHIVAILGEDAIRCWLSNMQQSTHRA